MSEMSLVRRWEKNIKEKGENVDGKMEKYCRKVRRISTTSGQSK
jgi:hypothetical protein